MPKRSASFHLTAELVDEIESRAKQEGRSRSNWLQQYLEGQLLARAAQNGTQPPILARPPRCAHCGHAPELHDDDGCTVPDVVVGGRNIGDCLCGGYRPADVDEGREIDEVR